MCGGKSGGKLARGVGEGRRGDQQQEQEEEEFVVAASEEEGEEREGNHEYWGKQLKAVRIA